MLNRIDEELSHESRISELLYRLSVIKNWNKEKKVLMGEIKAEILQKKWLVFSGDCRTYGISTLGEFAILYVPLGQKGALKKFSGQKIKVICLDRSEKFPGYSGRIFAAGVD